MHNAVIGGRQIVEFSLDSLEALHNSLADGCGWFLAVACGCWCADIGEYFSLRSHQMFFVTLDMNEKRTERGRKLVCGRPGQKRLQT